MYIFSYYIEFLRFLQYNFKKQLAFVQKQLVIYKSCFHKREVNGEVKAKLNKTKAVRNYIFK